MKIALIDKAPGKFNYERAFNMPLDVYHLASQEGLKRVLKKDVDIQINLEEYDYVILCGSEAVKNYTKITSVTDYSGRQIPAKDGSYNNFIASISPAALSFKPEIKPVFEETLLRINKIITGVTEHKIKNELAPIQDTQLAIDTLNRIKNYHMLEACPVLAFDTETTALYARKGYVLGISLSHTIDFGTYIDADYFDEYCVGLLQQLIDNPKCQIVGHNTKFDIHMLRYHFSINFDKAFSEGRMHDTMLLHYVLDERQGHGLKPLAMKYTDLGDYDAGLDAFKKEYCKNQGIKEDEFTYDLIPWDIISEYACLTHDSKVNMADGSTKTIGELVRSKSTEEVLSYNEKTGRIEPKKIIGWHKNPHKSKEWFKLDVYTGSKAPRDNHTGVINGPAFTEDHKIFTERGWVQVKDLVPGVDRILSKEKALSNDQLEMVFASLMGDGQLTSRNGNGAGLTLVQGKTHKQYGAFKAEMLGQDTVEFGSRGYVKVVTPYSAIWTDLYRELDIRENTADYKIRFPKELADSNFGWKFLTTWYLDDGNLANGKCPRIWSRTITEYPEDITSIIAWAKHKLGINIRYHNDDSNNQFFVVEPDSRELFFTMVAKFTPSEDMLYKIPSEFWVGFDNGSSWEFGFSDKLYFSKLYGVEQWIPTETRRGYSTKWCIDVEDNHNFYTPVGLVHNCLDTVSTIRLFYKFWPIVQSNDKLLSLYTNILMPATQFLQEVEDNGVPLSLARLLKAKEILTQEIITNTAKLYEFASVRKFEQEQGKIFNPGSPVQLRTLLFDYEGLPPTGKLTGTGALSTDAEVLEHLSEKSPLAIALLNLRKSKKLLSTYVEKMIQHIDTDGRLRTGFSLHTTTSGRLSCSGTINLQQLPRENPLIKGCIKPRDGYKIVALDKL